MTPNAPTATIANSLQATIADRLEASATRAQLCEQQLESKAVSLSSKQVRVFMGLEMDSSCLQALCWHTLLVLFSAALAGYRRSRKTVANWLCQAAESLERQPPGELVSSLLGFSREWWTQQVRFILCKTFHA